MRHDSPDVCRQVAPDIQDRIGDQRGGAGMRREDLLNLRHRLVTAEEDTEDLDRLLYREPAKDQKSLEGFV